MSTLGTRYAAFPLISETLTHSHSGSTVGQATTGSPRYTQTAGSPDPTSVGRLCDSKKKGKERKGSRVSTGASQLGAAFQPTRSPSRPGTRATQGG